MMDALSGIGSQILVKGQFVALVYFLGVNLWYLVLLLSSLLEMRRHLLLIADESRHLLLSSTLSPTISILAPAFNEESTIEASLKALLALQYPRLEVIVISDGSKDQTVQVLIDRFNLVPVKTIYEQRIKTKPVRTLYRSSMYPALVVVDKENGGKGRVERRTELRSERTRLCDGCGHPHRSRWPPAHGSPVPVRDGCRCDRRHDSSRQRIGGKTRPRGENPGAYPRAGGNAGRRISPRLSV